jgi:hypothetical protein
MNEKGMHGSYSGLRSKFICIKLDFFSKTFLFKEVREHLSLYKYSIWNPPMSILFFHQVILHCHHQVRYSVTIKSLSPSSFINHFQNKTSQRLGTTNQIVRDGGRSYSNSFNLCRGVHFTHKIGYIY